MNYAKHNQDNAILAVNTFHQDAGDTNPLIRALAIRTMGMIRVDKIMEYAHSPSISPIPLNHYIAITLAMIVADPLTPSISSEL